MFFLFIGGLEQQAGRVIKERAGRCIRCGSSAVDLVETEKVLKLFFVPVWRWPGKGPALYCRDCSFLFPQPFAPPPPPVDADEPLPALPRSLACRSCDRPVDPDFSFCPFCGAAL